MKKALAFPTIVGIALAIVVLFIIAIFVSRSTIYAGEQAKKYGCRESVELAAKQSIGMSLTSRDYAELINCPTHYLTIDTADSSQANKAIAEELRTCWWQMGEGKLDVFQHQSAVFCVVCSVIERWTGDKPVKGLEDWMREHKLEGKTMNYLEYMTGTSSGYADYSASQKFTPMSIDTKQKYAVVYVYSKEAFEWSTEAQMKKMFQQGISAESAVKYTVAYLFGWSTSTSYAARVVLVQYDSVILDRVLGCRVLTD